MKSRPRRAEAGSWKQEAGKAVSSLQSLASSLNRGFSLVELLIASVILALTGTLLIGGLLSANRSSELRAEQALLAQQLAGQVALLPEVLPADAAVQAPCPEAGDASCTIRLADGPLPNLKQVTVSLAHHRHTINVVTLRPIQEPQP